MNSLMNIVPLLHRGTGIASWQDPLEGLVKEGMSASICRKIGQSNHETLPYLKKWGIF